MKKEDQNLFSEILSSDRIGAFMSMAYDLPGLALPDSPSWVWEQIRWNPWLAMAIYEDIEEKDAMVASCLDTRKDGVLAKPRTVLPSSDTAQDKKIADFFDETLHSYFDASEGRYFGFDNFLFEALDAVAKGVSIGEIIYADGRDRIFVRDVRFKPQHLFAFGDTGTTSHSVSTYQYPQTGPLHLRAGVMVEDVPDVLPERKFFVHSYRPRYSNRWGSPLLRKIYWPSWFKRAAAKQWLRYLEKGSGSVVARYNDGAAAAEQDRALQAAQAINEEAAVAVPNKFIIDVLEQVRNIGNAHETFVDNFCNSEIARVLLGQTLTSRGSDGGGSRALGEVHNEVRGEKIEADSNSLMYAVNSRIIFPLHLANFGATGKPPLWIIKYNPQQDLTATAGWLGRLWEMHVPVKKSYVYNTFQLPEVGENDEDVLPPPAASGNDLRDLPQAAFAEKKTLRDGRLSGTSARQSNLRMERFARLRPSGMPRLET